MEKTKIAPCDFVREWVNSVQHNFLEGSMHLVDGTITFASQMGHSPSVLENLGRLLSGFNGATTTSQGDVVLPVPSWPSHPKCTILDGRGFIPFQCHYGTRIASRMKVAPSTYHHMVSYLTEEGQIDLLETSPVIHDLSDFRWPEPIKTDPAKRDLSRKCNYHKDHD
ncbi:hypothetical protein CK203_114435 [Vitis vinifera]|uniref:Uncharacterized protein n=1 Tax=Vitis vinifera TaxID=29760 RepID=A0A438CEZ6_VITVI|nr:hypothetical protein CK203_114435 [Vitis vinifera]